jgi:hypothetical protein
MMTPEGYSPSRGNRNGWSQADNQFTASSSRRPRCSSSIAASIRRQTAEHRLDAAIPLRVRPCQVACPPQLKGFDTPQR